MRETVPAQPVYLDSLPASQRLARHAAWCLFTVVFLVCIGLQPLRNDVAAGGDGDLVRQLSYIGIFVITMLVVRRSRWITHVPLTIVLVFGWCWLSISWAIEPGIALRRIALTTLIAATIFAAVDVAGTRKSLAALSSVFLVALALNYLIVFISPTGIHQPGGSSDLALVGNWRGATLHKNFAGALSAITVLVLLFAPRQLPRPLHWSAIGAAAYFLWRTQSKTSIALLGLALVAALLFCLLSPRARKFILPGAVLIFGTIWLLFNDEIVQPISALLSQPDAFTGRTEVWAALVQYASENWLLGSGYGSFWGIGARSPINDIVNSWVADLLSGHSGYLDVLTQIGVPGLVLAILAMIVMPMVRATSSRVPTGIGALLIAMLIFCTGHNLSESSLMSSYSFVGVAFIVAAALAAKLSRETAAAVRDESAMARAKPTVRPVQGEQRSFGQ